MHPHCLGSAGSARRDVGRPAYLRGPVLQDAVVWNALYTVRGRNAIFGAFNLWCALNHVTAKITRIGKPSIHALQWRFESTSKSFMCPAGRSTSGKPCSARRQPQCHILCLSAVPKLQ